MIKQVVSSVVLTTALLLSFPVASAQGQDTGGLETEYTLASLPKLAPEGQHKAASRRIASYFTRYHYSRVELDEAMAEQIFNRYFEQLDYNRMFFLASDVNEFNRHRKNFHEQLLNGDLEAAYAIHQRGMQRRFERFQYALSVVASGIDFEEQAEEFRFDRSEAEWATSSAELDEIWHNRVLNDALNLMLAGRSDEEIRDNLKRRYRSAIHQLTQTQSEDAFQNVMNAFARSVDAHTSYLSPRNAERFQQNMNLSLEGIGAVLQAEFDYTVIRSLVPGGPADKSGKLSPDDRIIAVAQGDQEFVDIIGWRLDDVVEIIKGPKGSVVRLQVLKGGEAPGSSPVEVEIVREEVRLEDREAKLSFETADDGTKYAVITIPGFYNKLTEKVQQLLAEVRASDAEGLLIDLRGNGGGALNESITLTGLFIPSGPVVQVRDSTGRIDVSGDPDPQVHYDGPMVIMIDRFSASASEIFAAALQDYRRALVVGENSFGKGTVQQHRGLARRFDLNANPMGSVQYTMAKFYRIDGGSTQHKGVVPDIQYPSLIDPEEFGESRADNALPWDQIEPVDFQRFGYINDEILAALNAKHAQRVADDPEFAYIQEDAERFKTMRKRTHISLVKAEREAESARERERNLARVNERLVRAGLEPVESLDDVDDELRSPDIFMRETLRVASDYLRLLRQEN
ncbi:carboxy terminal-processing peptidase [Aliidiomarina haloalkalitolerans]|uniref:Carboxy terminal-processing peptidase n=1 Tax=Aliidiomarina haloalkalitolerans TaxID=859059 RepID=A0A432VYA7_9GAMM|nr:carboxy terminal-processing peptidase [Aliidiomarina haloalkalitolerans]MCL4409655.1 carboxy terminal-processing peptidase [Gammaproteobacteria bacterium]RUO21647.1 carboxy terminal-processing peptidase [Aliidiomarina haloalkalitolerans]